MITIVLTLCLGSRDYMDSQISKVRLENKNAAIIAVFKECEEQ